jgi:signal peptidase II
MQRLGKAASIALVLFMVSCDHGTKHLAKTHLEGRRAFELVPGVFDLRYIENTDSAFSLLGSVLAPEPRLVVLLVLKALAIAGLLTYVLLRFRQLGAMERAGASLVLAGGIGNLTDRLLRGYVIDFLHLHHWPVFNAADIAISIGIGLLLLGSHRRLRAAPELSPT